MFACKLNIYYKKLWRSRWRRWYFKERAPLWSKNTDLLKTRIDAGQIAIAELPGGPSSPALLGQHFAGTRDWLVYLIAKQILAVQPAAIARVFAIWRLAPVAIVDLENAIIMGAIAIRRTHNASAIWALMLGNASPAGQLIAWYAQLGHFACQTAAIHGACLGRCCQQHHGKQSDYKESLHSVVSQEAFVIVMLK